MLNSFKDKVIVITGASSGIGKELAVQMAGEGVHLILAARNTVDLEKIKYLCEAKGAVCIVSFLDISSEDSIRDFSIGIKSSYQVLDILINNAGISQRSHAEETGIEVDRRIMEVNFFGHVNITKQLWPLLCKSPHANIVLMSSVVGTFGISQRSAYSASKHALEGFFESWMIENTRPNIHFTTISAGRIKTNISLSALKSDGTPHQIMDKGQLKGIPVEKCVSKIIQGIIKDKRKVYVVQSEMVLVVLRKVFPFLYFWIVKKFKLG